MSRYLVGRYYPFEIQSVSKKTAKIKKLSLLESDNVGKCSIKAEIVQLQRVVGYLSALEVNGSLGGEFIEIFEKSKVKLKKLSKKYPEKII